MMNINKIVFRKPANIKTTSRPFFHAPLSGSITVEAALCIPLFLVAAAVIIFGFNILNIKLQAEDSMMLAVKSAVIYEDMPLMAVREYYSEMSSEMLEKQGLKSPGIAVVTAMGGNDFKLSADYYVSEPLFGFPGIGLGIHQDIQSKYFSGYVLGSSPATDEQAEYIHAYFAENGVVYHSEENCTYLHIKPEMKATSELTDLRNDYGSKYKPCERCSGSGNGSYIWVTADGEKYHGSLDCSGLKRTYKEVIVKKGSDIKFCSRCGGNHD